jgi:hypothetical protein
MADNLGITREKPGIKAEIAIIPRGMFVLAAIIFAAPACFLLVGWFRQRPTPPLFGVFAAVLVGTLLALLTLMIGYVNRDAGRRGMSRKLWTLIVIFVPNAIGFILYFLMRNPLRVNCPKCGTAVDAQIAATPSIRLARSARSPFAQATRSVRTVVSH